MFFATMPCGQFELTAYMIVHYNMSGGMKTPNKEQIRSGERLNRDIVKKALAGITEVKAFIHRINLHVDDYSYEEITTWIGKGKVFKAEDNKYHYNNLYKNCSYHSCKNHKITVYWNPVQPFYKHYRFSLTTHSQKILNYLAEKIPELKISTAEYTIDIMCKDREAVSDMFYVLRRYMYFPHRMNTDTIGGKFSGIEAERETNAAYYVWQRAKGKKDIVIYERGDDCSRVGKQWPYDTVDRVRIEFLIRHRQLHNYNVKSVKRFVANNHFSELVQKRFRFCTFKKGGRLPQPYQDYCSEDNKNNAESFQEEYMQAKKVIKNISQYLVEADELAPLYSMITEAIQQFEDNWSRRYINHMRKKLGMVSKR